MTKQAKTNETETNNAQTPDKSETAKTLLQQLEEQGLSLNDLRKAKKASQPPKRKYDKVDFTSTIAELHGLDREAQWQVAIEHVTMPVQQVPAEFQLTGEDGKPQGEHLSGDYVTDNGRTGTWSFIVVDRWRDGNFRVVSPVTDYYAALMPESIYTNLKEAMDSYGDIEYKLTQAYNSFSGGHQLLELEVSNLADVNLANDVIMKVTLSTSLDRSRKHTLRAVPVTKDNKPLLIHTNSSEFNLSVRHMTSAAEKAVDFNHALGQMIGHWNEDIMPMVSFLFDCDDLSNKDIYACMESIMEDAKLPKSSVEEITKAMKRDKSLTLAQGVATVSEYADTLESPMNREKTSEAVGKAVAKRIKKLMADKSA